MIGNRWIPVLVIFAAGAATGWLLKPVTPAVVQLSTKVAERHPAARPVRVTSARTKVARQWMHRIETSEVREVAKAIPAGDFEPLIEALMATVWGGMSAKQLEQFMVLIGNWSDQDPDGALAWARALENPKQREVGLIGIAAKVAKDDPKAAFEIYAELEEITTNAGRYLSVMMWTLYNDAAKQGVEAVLELARRTPKNGTNGSEGIAIEFPPEFDFRTLIDGLIEATDLGGSRELYKPFAPSDPFGSWAVQDADAAFDYIVDGTSQGQFLRWCDMPHELGEKWGTVEADRWMGAKLAGLSPEEQRALLSKSDLAHRSGTLRKYIANMPTEEAAAEFRFQYMDYTKKSLQLSLEVLNDVPEVQDRVAAIERLRGVSDDRALRHYLSNLNLAANRIDEIVETVKQPAEPEG